MIDLNWKIPSSIDLEAMIKKDPPAFLGKKKSNLDNFYYIIDLFVDKSLTDDLEKSKGYLRLYSNFLQKRMTKDYKKYLDYLIKHRVLEREDKKYKISNLTKEIIGEPYSYRLNVNSGDSLDINKVPIIGETHKKKRKKIWRKLQQEQKAIKRKNQDLTKWFEDLEIDFVKAKNWINKNPDYQLGTGPIKGNLKGKAKKQIKRLKAIYSLDKISKKEFHFTIDDKGGRFHSNLTNLKRELRNFLSWKGQRIINVDIKNSQPFFSQLLFLKYWYEKSKYMSIHDFPNIINPFNSRIKLNELISNNNITSGEFLQNTDYKGVKTYFDYVNSGEFYLHLHQKIYGDQKEYSKDKMKEMTFQVLYSSNQFYHQKGDWYDKKTDSFPNAEPKRRFDELFPNVYHIFYEYKREEKNNLAILLQQIESTLILKHIVPRIAKEKPELPIFTIHDSIATTEGNEEYVEEVMYEEIYNLTGLKAKFGKEKWFDEEKDGLTTGIEKD